MKNIDYIKKNKGITMELEQKILIVDDKKENLVALENVLKETNAQIIRAYSGNEALKASLHYTFALAILDVQMPEMDGYELAELLRGEKKTKLLPIIFMSAVYSDDYYIFKGYDAGGVDYLVKPFNPVILLSKVNIFLQLDAQKTKLLEMIEIEASKNHLENILMTTPDLVFVISCKGIIETANWTVSTATHYDRDKILGMPIGKLFKDQHLESWINALKKNKINKKNSLRNMETTIFTAKDTKINVLLSGSRLKDRSGIVQGAVIVAVDITNRIRTEKELEQRTHDLGRRVKELDCLFKISKLLEKPEKKIEKTFQSIINLIPQTWQYPEITCAILTMDGKQIKTNNYVESPWQQISNIVVHGETIGLLKIGYTEKAADNNQASFLDEEKRLLNIIAERIGSIVERIQAEKKAEHLNVVLRALRNVNQLITREKDKDWLIQSVCNTLVDTRGYSSSWIILQDKTGKIIKSAGAGLAKEISFTKMVKEHGMLLCGKMAMDQDGVIAFENIANNCFKCPMKKSCAGSGAMTVRLESDNKVFGFLAVTTPEYLATDEEEQSLFKEVGNDIAFALHNIESDAVIKQTKKALYMSQEKYLELVETIEDWIWEIDAGGIYTYVSPRIISLLGYTPEEVLGKSPNDLLAEPEHSEESSAFSRIIPLHKKFSGLENQYLKKDGGVVMMETSGAPFFNETGTFQGYFGVDRDITERKRLESQLQQSQKMEAIGTLTGGIAHDFNNILFPITAYTEMTMDEIDKDNPVQEHLKGVLQAAQRAKELIKQILSISRNSDKELLVPLTMQSVIKETLKLLRASIPATIEIEHDIVDKCSKIMADSTKIHQIIMNLCTNAYHAMEETGGVLKVSLTQLTREETGNNSDLKKNNYLCLMVKDTGHGMTKTLQEKIFDPYFSTKGKDKGTGMGLSIVRGILKNYGGDIKVISEPGKGSCFYAYFPTISDSETMDLKIIDEKVIQGGDEHILLVDDEASIIKIEKRILSGYGYKVTGRISSTDALELFKSSPDMFDLVITDMTMPRMTGFQLAEKIIKIKPDIPIILCTGFHEGITKEKFKASGIVTYLKKPVMKDIFSKTVRDVLDKAKM